MGRFKSQGSGGIVGLGGPWCGRHVSVFADLVDMWVVKVKGEGLKGKGELTGI